MPILGVVSSSVSKNTTDFRFLASTTLSSTQATISFSSNGVWADYKHLRLVASMKDNRGQYNSVANIYVNSDSTAANYRTQQMEFDMRNNNTWYGAGGDGTTIFSVPGATAASYFAAGWVDFYDINDTTRFKTFYSQSVFNQGGTASGQNNYSSGAAVWENTGAITSIQVTDSLASFVSGTTMTLYGIKG